MSNTHGARDERWRLVRTSWKEHETAKAASIADGDDEGCRRQSSVKDKGVKLAEPSDGGHTL